jgi:hypothetical protein
MIQYSRALPAKEGFLAGYFLESNIYPGLGIMFCPAVNPDEVDQDLQIILLWDGELFHGCILDEKVNGRHDAGQKIPFAPFVRISLRGYFKDFTSFCRLYSYINQHLRS